jgi:ribosomal protein S18 acetylase RimI-like enzyme
VRHRVGEKLSDAVGELNVDGTDLVVQTRRGPVRVRRSAVTAVRAIPPAVPRRASLSAIARLEDLCADAWPALVEERLGAWRLRAADGYTGRANAALAIGSPGLPTGAALDAVRAFADRHGIQPRVQVPIGSPWDRAVAAEGWVLDEGHAAGAVVSVQVADLEALAGVGPTTQRAEAASPADAHVVERRADLRGQGDGGWATWTRAASPDDVWWRLVLGLSIAGPTPAQRHVLVSPPTADFLLLHDDSGNPVAAGRAVLVEDHLHLSVLTVDPGSRRRGYGTRLLGAAAAWGREHGARWGVLQVAVHNSAALALYAKTGWTEHHQYRYLVPD